MVRRGGYERGVLLAPRATERVGLAQYRTVDNNEMVRSEEKGESHDTPNISLSLKISDVRTVQMGDL